MPITQKNLTELDIPEGVIIVAVHRGEHILIPDGTTQIQDGDRVLVLSLLTSVPSLEALFKNPHIR